MRSVFIDTNLLIHYEPVNQINWADYFEENQLLFLIPICVIQELDKHKYSEKLFLQKRSKKIISWLNDIHDGNSHLPSHLNIEIIVDEASDDIFQNYKLLREVPDDRIIATIIEYVRQNPQKDVSIVTADFALSVKAKKFQIQVQQLSEDYKLKSTISDEEKRINQLEKENIKLKSSHPDIEILFNNGKLFCKKTIRKPLLIEDEFEDSILKNIEKKYPKKESRNFEDKKNVIINDLARIEFPNPLKKPTNKYNEEIEEFYSEYLSFKKNQFAYLESKRRSFELDIVVSNIGSAPAQDVDVWLHFPDGFTVIDGTDDFIERPERPKPPSEMYSTGLGIIPHSLLSHRMPDFSHFNSPPTVGGLDIKKTNSYEVTSSIVKIKHNQSERLDPITILFYPDDEVIGFNIDYKIDVGNYPNRIEGQLNVNVEEI